MWGFHELCGFHGFHEELVHGVRAWKQNECLKVLPTDEGLLKLSRWLENATCNMHKWEEEMHWMHGMRRVTPLDIQVELAFLICDF